MRTVQMTLDDDLVRLIDQVAKSLQTTRSAFARLAFREAIRKFKRGRLEEKHRQGYQARPTAKGEFDAWEEEHAWGET